MKKNLALFDFDHTLYTKDSLLEVTKHIAGTKKFYRGLILLSPYLLALKLGLMHNAIVKEKYLTHFFKGYKYNVFSDLAAAFAITAIEKDLALNLKSALNTHLANGDDVYIVTASFAEWIAPWARQKNITVIASLPEIKDGCLTGTIKGKNCYGPEKVSRIRAVLNPDEYDAVYVYGKGKGDREMLGLNRLSS